MSEEMCERCGHMHPVGAQECKNCRTLYWEYWNAEWYEGRFVMASLGRSVRAKRVAKSYFVGCIFSFVFVLFYIYISGALSKMEPLSIVLFALFLYSGYQVFSFARGSTSGFARYSYPARPEYTMQRVICVCANILLAVFLWIVFFKNVA